MPNSGQIYVKAHYRNVGDPKPKWVAYHHASNSFLQSVRGPMVKHRHPPERLFFKRSVSKYLAQYDGEDWKDGWTLLAVR